MTIRRTLTMVIAATVLGAALLLAEAPERQVTILYTNDFHSALDPIPAYWRPDSPRLGGAAQLSTLINQVRGRERATFLLDAGDMFTGSLSFLTRGEVLMEMMMAMRYDAMVIGNHEFDYGAANFEKQMHRVSFPVLGANIVYRGTNHRYSRPWAILERDGVRLGVIGVIGLDARSVALPAGITELDFTDPVAAVAAGVAELEGSVDLIVVLTHQGKTGPMQTDAEARPDVQRDFDEDARLAGMVPGIDVLIGGHAHRGIEQPWVHPTTGTLVVQTYGYGTRLGYLRLNVRDGKVTGHDGRLLEVRSDALPPDPIVEARLAPYREAARPVIGEVVGALSRRLVRDYRGESSLGSFVADVMRETASAEVAFQNAGGLRADLPAGAVTKGHVLDALPFVNSVVTMELTGDQVRRVLEQGLTLERGMIQVSGLRASYDPGAPAGRRLVALEIAGVPVDDARRYRVATNSFLAQGGDLYTTFLEGTAAVDGGELLSEVVMRYLRSRGEVGPPASGRLVPRPPTAR
jgi:2',3'-cyclic-nucleotide 2'-phosphodiesterase (5'-nucleotidase family)